MPLPESRRLKAQFRAKAQPGAKVQKRDLERGRSCAAVGLVRRFVVRAMEKLKFVAAIASGASNSTGIDIQFTRCTTAARPHRKP